MLEPALLPDTIFREMMSHPVLFTHRDPKKIAIFGDKENQILYEVLKHPNILEIYHAFPKEKNSRILNQLTKEWDIVIDPDDPNDNHLQKYYALLSEEGILIQKSPPPFELNALQSLCHHLKHIGFREMQLVHFPQPSGWGSAIMVTKKGVLKRPREKKIFNKPFKTLYYNFDTHQASLVLPEFMKEDIS